MLTLATLFILTLEISGKFVILDISFTFLQERFVGDFCNFFNDFEISRDGQVTFKK